MSMPAPDQQLLDREFLPVRAKILEIAASFDRIQRARDDAQDDARLRQLRSALEIVLGPRADRTEKLQMLFSRPYQEAWRETWGI